MTISEKLLQLNEIKTAIRNSINAKGGQLTESSPFATYSLAIDNLTGSNGGDVEIIVTEPNITYQNEVESGVVIPFTTLADEPNSSIENGVRQLKTAGVNGTKDITWSVEYADGVATGNRTFVSETITKPVVNEVYYIGTKSTASNVNVLNVSRVQSVGSNDLLLNGVKTTNPFNPTHQEIFKWGADGRVRLWGDNFEGGKTYTLKFTFTKKSGSFLRLGGYLSSQFKTNINNVFRDGVDITSQGVWDEATGYPMNDNTLPQTYHVYLTMPPTTGSAHEFNIEPNATASGQVTYFLDNLSLFEGHSLV